MDAMEVIVVMGVTAVGRRTPHHRLGVDGIHTGHIQRHRVEGGEHSHIGNNGGVVLGAAVAVGRHVDDQ